MPLLSDYDVMLVAVSDKDVWRVRAAHCARMPRTDHPPGNDRPAATHLVSRKTDFGTRHGAAGATAAVRTMPLAIGWARFGLASRGNNCSAAYSCSM